MDVAAALFVIVALVKRLGVVSDIEHDGFSFGLLDRAQSSDDLVSSASIVFLILLVGTAICFMTWMFRAAKNNEALGRRGARFGPGWAIGAWFIPLANFVIPVLMMQDLWRGSDADIARDAYWRESKRSALIGVWWAMWLLHLIRFAGGGSADDETLDLDEIRSSNRVALVGFAFAIPAALFAIQVVRKLTQRQEHCLQVQQAQWAETQGSQPPTA
jgi:ABC-type Fe3+ transport system permease subunit